MARRAHGIWTATTATFVLSGADLLYWRRKQEQWRSIAERAPDEATANYLHDVFEPTARAIAGLEGALAGLGLLDEALSLGLRRPRTISIAYGARWSTPAMTASGRAGSQRLSGQSYSPAPKASFKV